MGQHASKERPDVCHGQFKRQKVSLVRVVGTVAVISETNVDTPERQCWKGKHAMVREEGIYQRRVWEYLYAHVNDSLPWDSLDHAVLQRPLELHWAIVYCTQVFFDIELEARFRVDPRMDKVMAQWNNVEKFATPTRFRRRSYIEVLNW